ncbi:MAG: hypothetical protein JXJ04_11055 [Spirochaetales bacterium]|nr:hypothetical protein [Spirochaetales bacterium]
MGTFYVKVILCLLFCIFIMAQGFGDTIINSDIDSSVTWTLENSPYIVTGKITVGTSSGYHPVITIEPGVEVRCETGSSFFIYYGSVHAAGTTELPVTFTSASLTPAPGDWDGIFIAYHSINSSFTNCIIEYGNRVLIDDSPSTLLDHCTISHSIGYGVYIKNTRTCTDVFQLTHCTIENNQSDGIYIERNTSWVFHYKMIIRNNTISFNDGFALNGSIDMGIDISDNTGTGNTHNVIRFSGESMLGKTIVLGENPGLPYLLSGNIDIGNNTTTSNPSELIINPGAKICFDPGSSLAITTGEIEAAGTPGNQIVFTSAEAAPQPGDWGSIGVANTSPHALFRNCIIEYGGGSNGANIYNNNNRLMIIEDCIIQYSEFCGLKINNTVSSEEVLNIKNNSFLYNNTHGISILRNTSWAQSYKVVIRDNVISHNGGSALESGVDINIEIRNNTGSGNSQDVLKFAGEWMLGKTLLLGENPGLPYLFGGSINIGNNTTTGTPSVVRAEAGATMCFDYGSSLIISTGTLEAAGTDTKKVRFTSLQENPQPGDWSGIRGSHDSSIIILHNAIIEYGGFGVPALINLVQDGTLTSDSSIVRNSSNGGIQVDGNAAVTINQTHFLNNAASGFSCGRGTIDITNSVMAGNDSGIEILGDISSINIKNNTLTGNTIGIQNNTTSYIDATENNWGHPTGPKDFNDDSASGGYYNPDGLGDDVSDYIAYKPWLLIPYNEIKPLLIETEESFRIESKETLQFSFDSQPDKTLLFCLSSESEDIYVSETTTRRKSNTKNMNGMYELIISPTEMKTYYFTVMCLDTLTASEINVHISYLEDVYINDVTPKNGANLGEITLSIKGYFPIDDYFVSLEDTTGNRITSIRTDYAGWNMISVIFDMTDRTPGIYDVVVENTSGVIKIFSAAFTIMDNTNPGHITASIDFPEYVRIARTYTAKLNYINVENSDVFSPVFVLRNSENAPMALKPGENTTNGKLMILGLSHNGNPVRIGGREENSIPIAVSIPPDLRGHTIIDFSVEQLVEDDTLIDWNSFKDNLDITEISTEAAEALWQRFTQKTGSTQKEFITRIREIAAYLRKYGSTEEHILIGNTMYSQEVSDPGLYDVNKLVQFDWLESMGAFCPRKILAGRIDVAVTAPGIDLTFGSSASHIITERYYQGPFGRGWRHLYDIKAYTDTMGNVIIKSPGTLGGRKFALCTDNSFTPEKYDPGILVIDNGNYMLTETDGSITIYSITSGALLKIIDANNNSLSFGYDNDRLTEISHSNGMSIFIDYTNTGRIRTITYPPDKVNTYYYSSNEEYLTRVVYSGGYEINYEYDAENHALNKVVLPGGIAYSYQYDTAGRLVGETGPSDVPLSTYSYDELGTVTIRDALDNETTMYYGLNGQVLQITDALGRKIRNNSSPAGQLAGLTGPLGTESKFVYNPEGKLTSTKDPLGNITRIEYDNRFNYVKRIIDARGNALEYEYDEHGNTVAIIYEDGTQEVYDYDLKGLVSESQNRREQSILYNRDDLGRIIEKIYPDDRRITYNYDQSGNMIAADDTFTGQITMEYNTQNLLTKIVYPGGQWFEYEYDYAQRRTKRRDNDGEIINYIYTNGELTSLTDGMDNVIISYEYDVAGNLKTELKGNGTRTSYEYNSTGQLINLINYSPENNIVSSFEYGYDDNGNRTSMTTEEGTTGYEYDKSGQLAKVIYPDGTEDQFTYDESGNRIESISNGIISNYTVNNMNQYEQSGSAAYTYDDDGNMLSKTDHTGTTMYTWDAENRLIEIAEPSGAVCEYRYDALGNRVYSARNGIEKHYIHELSGLTDVAAEYDAEGVVTAKYTHGLGLVAVKDTTGNRHFYSFDALGSTRELTDQSGSVVNNYDYDVFGKTEVLKEAIQNPFTYVGRYGVQEEGSGLKYMRARYYEENTGRFISEDPIGITGEDMNFYRYCRNNPVSFIDPEGNELISGIIVMFALYTPQIFTITALGAALYKLYPQLVYSSYFLCNSLYHIDKIAVALIQLYKKYGKLAKYVIKNIDDINRYMKVFSDFMCSSALYDGFAYGIEYWWDKVTSLFDNASSNILDGTGALTPMQELALNLVRQFSKSTEAIRPNDPNEKTGPPGVGLDHYITRDSKLIYTIYFENKSTASAPAQEVFIYDYVDENTDVTTLELGDIACGKTIVTSLSGQKNGEFTATLDDLAVKIKVDFAPETGLLSWYFKTIDLETGELPEDALAGFLPPEDGNGSGQGYVIFTINPKSGLDNGTIINNSASIIFDTEQSINTNTVWNTITDPAPGAPSVPGIEDGATGVVKETNLSWESVTYATAYDVYLWPANISKPELPVVSDTTLRYFDISLCVEYNTAYNWQVIARNVMGQTEGPVWSFTTGEEPLYEPVMGDVNFDNTIDIVDALLAAQHYIGLNPQGFYPGAADVTHDGKINIVDSLFIARYYTGLIDSFE